MKASIFTTGLITIVGISQLSAQDLNIPKTVINAASQKDSKATVKGKVVYGSDNKVVEMANVVLTSATNENEEYFNYSNANGEFSIDDVPAGEYKLNVYMVGFSNLSKTVNISSNNSNIGQLTLTSNSGKLKEVEIIEFKKIIEQRPDGINYNVENDKSASGTMATDVLRKVPMVTVDMEGNVKLRGSDNIKVLIDGKPSELLASSVKDALRQIPGDNIKSIEVITSPGAKYDGEGASGVINIITKKKVVGGFSGTVFAAPSYNFDAELLNGNVGANINYRKDKWGLNTSFGYSRWAMKLESTGKRTDDIGGTLNTLQNMHAYGNFGWAKVGFDYQFDSLQNFQASVNYNPGEWNQNMDLQSRYQIQSNETGFNRDIKQLNPRNTYGVNAAYTKKSAKKKGRLFDLLGAYSINNSKSGYNTNSSNLNAINNEIDYREENKNNKSNKEITIQADYTEPLKLKGQKLEFGLKGINRNISSDFTLYTQSNGQSDFTIDPNRSNKLTYNQFVGSAYGQITTPLVERLTMVGGLRYETTNIHGNVRDGLGDFDLPMFNNILPNVVFMYNFKNFSSLKLSYNKRINRPSIDFVNPYIDYSDTMNLKQGNVNLVPERTHNIELGYSTFIKRSSVNASLFHRYTGNAIEQTTFIQQGGVSMTSYGNVAKANVTGLDLFANTTLFKKVMVNINGNIYYKQLESESMNLKNSGWQYSGNLYANYTINQTYSLNGFAMYSGNQVMLQGQQKGWYYYFLGAQMNILKGKGTLGIAAENFLTPKMDIKTRFNYRNGNLDMNSVYIGRGVRMSFNWNFGKMKYAQEKQIKNDDLKKSDSGQMGGGMGGR